MRKGILIAAVAGAFALAAPAAHATPSPLALGPIEVNYSFSGLNVPYTLDTTGVATLSVEVKRPGAPDFEHVGDYDPQPAGELNVFRLLDAGEVRIRVSAVAPNGTVLDTEEVATTIKDQTLMGSLTPGFATPVEVGTTEIKRARFEGWGLVGLRIRNLRLTGDPDFTIVSENCSGRAVSLDGCEVQIAFTPIAVGERKTRMDFDANAPGGGYELSGTGKFTPSEPLLPQTTPQPAPAPTPAATAVDPPELAFNSAPSRKDTKLSGLRMVNLPAGSTVTVKCAKGCATKSLTKRNVSGSLSLASFAKRRLKVGTTIRVTLTAPGAKPTTTTLKIRANREPSVTTR